MSGYWRRAAFLGAVAVALATGCAQEREPINRVQPNALAKSFFVGANLQDPTDDPEFWTQATLIDAPFGVSQGWIFPSTFSQDVARIKWQITEDLLLGRLTYELIQGADGKGAGGAKDNDGQIIVAYKISSHFDIRRAYNPSTGEELNVIEENSTDRPWYDREYFRVDWSENLQTDVYNFDTLSFMGLDGVKYSSLAYYVSDPSDPDAPYFDVAGGYFDVTNKAFATPGLIDLSSLGWGMGAYPACMLPDEFSGGTAPAANCNPSELTLRVSFRRVEDHDYQPGDWDGLRFSAFGAFYKDRYGYARNYGMSDTLWHRLVNRYQVWERSHYYGDSANMTGQVECYTPETTPYGADSNRDLDNNGTADECEDVSRRVCEQFALGNCSDPAEANRLAGGSQCDTFKQRCTLPFRFRTVKPLVWMMTIPGTLDYYDGTNWATHNWDAALRFAVQVARYSECRETGSDQPTCSAGYPVYFGQMDDHEEFLTLSAEVDDCRHGVSYVGANGQPNYGVVNSPERELACQGVADLAAAARSGNGVRPLDAGIVEMAKMPEAIVLCHSPVELNDPAACATPEQRLPAGITAQMCATAEDNRDETLIPTCKAAKYARRGDLRYHLINNFYEPHTPSPWGIMTNGNDPVTGEVISAGVTCWTYVNELFSQGVMDRIRFIKGELSAADVTEAQYIDDYAKAETAAAGGSVAGHLTAKGYKKRIAAATGVSAEQLDEQVAHMDPAVLDKARAIRDRVAKQVRFSAGAPSVMDPIYEARRQKAMGTEVEAALMNPMIQQLNGVSGMPLTDEVMNYGSPLRGAHPGLEAKVRKLKESALARRGACQLMDTDAPAPVGVMTLGNILEEKFKDACIVPDDLVTLCKQGSYISNLVKNGNPGATDQDVAAVYDQVCVQKQPLGSDACLKYGGFNKNDEEGVQAVRADRMRKFLAQRAQLSVIVHEMGHSMAARHNFVSSSDAFSFRPQYWQLRTKDGTQKTACTEYDATGACLGPRYFDPVTQPETDGIIWMWEQDSTMEYAGEYTQDTLGIGVWDFAGAAMWYGDNSIMFDDASYRVGKPRARGMISKLDDFGGILGIQPSYNGNDIHYSQLNARYELIKDCQAVPDPQAYKPAAWNDNYGTWHPLMDGLMVKGDGTNYTKCRMQKVEYVPWRKLRPPTVGEVGNAYGTQGGAIDKDGRVRVPYGFASDDWADIGNASVYRHDNGADVYEIFSWLATQNEMHHIFDDYRRKRVSFSLRAQSNRTLERYLEKIRDGAKGLALYNNIYRDVAEQTGEDFDTWWPSLAWGAFPESTLASSYVFDHFVRTFIRPEVGNHFIDDPPGQLIPGSGGQVAGDEVLRSVDGTYLQGTLSAVNIPNGAYGVDGPYGSSGVSYGGKVVENKLCANCGDYDRDYTMNVGSYYDKVNTPYLMCESVDNFISDQLGDFVDKRYRAISMADLFPDGFRRFMANMLTGDDRLKGAWIETSQDGKPKVGDGQFPAGSLGWPSYWTPTPEVCFPATGTTVCNSYGVTDPSVFDPQAPAYAMPIDPQVGWETQKFLINWTMLYLPENQKEKWINQMWLWEVGQDAVPWTDPALAPNNRIEFHDPIGKTYIAKTFGKENIFGKVVQRGISARVLEWANVLLQHGYDCDPGPDLDGDGNPDWYIPKTGPNGEPIIAYDQYLAAGPNCNSLDNSGCTCTANRWCIELEKYTTIPYYLRQTMVAYGIVNPEETGLFNF